MLIDLAKKAFRKSFRLVGLDVVRYSRNGEPSQEHELPLYDDPLEALCYNQGEKAAAFTCPIDKVVKQNGLSYARQKWHPFVEALREYEAGRSTCYDDSLLRRYYDLHQPAHAAGAVVGFGEMPEAYREHPPHVYRLTPWRSIGPATMDRMIRVASEGHSQLHGGQQRSFDAAGYQYHGPVSQWKGELEYQRLVSVYESIKRHGFMRSLGHPRFLVMRRGDEYRFLAEGDGNHRTAAMAALGFDRVPAVFKRDHIVDLAMAPYWPQVKRGTWTVEEAVAYFNHLFDFDSRVWACERGLVVDGGSS